MNDTNNYMSDDFDTNIDLTFPNSRSLALMSITRTFIQNNTLDAYSQPEEVSDRVVGMIRHMFINYNATTPKGAKITVPTDLTPATIAELMLAMYDIKTINCAGNNSEREYDILGIYQEDGENKGIYISDEIEIHKLIRRFNPGLNTYEEKQTVTILRQNAERVERCSDPDLIAINNGIFNYKTKTVEPFRSDLVFTAKCRVDYNPAAKNVTIHNDTDNTDWNVEDWILELFDDPDIAECIWQIMGAVIRPNVYWRKAAWFVSEKGNNGKGTLCSLMRNLAGNQSCVAIQLSDFGKDFMLEPLVHATSIITDENDVGTYIDKAANLKAIITNDVVQVNRKFKTPIAYQFRGFMVQCMNEMPRTKDKSESFYRRQLFIPFTKCYTGKERKYIKDDYLNRPEVLEYVLYRILNMNYYEIMEPELCKKALNEYKTYNDPIRDFLQEIMGRARWGCYPSQLLYEMYKGWSKANNPNGSVQGRNTFLNDVKQFIMATDGWYFVDSANPKRVSGRMDGEEPLIEEYNCEAWMADTKTCEGRIRISSKKKKDRIGGIFRDDCTAGSDDDTGSNDNDDSNN